MANSQPMIQLLQNELDAARNHIQALGEQNQAAVAEIAALRNQNAGNTFVAPEDPVPPYWVRPPPLYTHPTNPNFMRPPVYNPTMPFTFQHPGGATDSSQRNEIPNSGFTHQTANDTSSNDPIARRLQMLEEQNERVINLLAKLPGAAVPIDVEPRTGYQASPFVDSIALMDVPKKYNIPTFTPKYSGIADPTEHVAQYKQLMWTISIPQAYQEACMCKSFGATLTGAALQWLINLKPKTIGSFAELINQFSQQFASSRKMEKQTSDLYYVVQKDAESIRDYFNRFNAEMISIRNCDVKTAIEAYKRGLDETSGLYLDLTKYPPENFEDVRARTLAYMRVEDDIAFRRKHSGDKKSLGIKKPDFKAKLVHRPEPPRQISHVRFEKKGTTSLKANHYPKISSYNFAGTTKDLIYSLKQLQQNIRWPKKSDRDDDKKDKSKWCDFHNDFGHVTDECIALKKELAWLESRGCLQELSKKETTKNDRPPSPTHANVVNCITGGSDVCGMTYSAAKRHASRGPDDHPIPKEVRSKEDLELETMPITFDQTDLDDEFQKHHDGLIIQLTIGNCLIKRILIDGGSSANVIFFDTVKAMGIDKSEVVRRSTTLVGFNGGTTYTMGEITLPVYAKGVNKQTKFNVVDCSSAYNVILGRPWIHDMKAVPSTYHQTLKFPTPWGIQEIRSEQKVARECYKTSLKPSKRLV